LTTISEDHKGEVVPIEYTAAGLSLPFAGAHKDSEIYEPLTTRVKEGKKFEHGYPDNGTIKPL
jgi:hypothetical protein